MNKEALSFFEQIKAITPVTETGEIDVSKLESVITSGDNRQPIYQYILSKIPEFYIRGSKPLTRFKDFFQKKEETSYEKYSDLVLSRLMKGDFSDIKNIEKIYPYLVKLSNYLTPERIYIIMEMVRAELWESKLAIIDSWKEGCEKYSKEYDFIIHHNGDFSLEGKHYYDISSIDILLKSGDIDKELASFAKKIIEYYKRTENNITVPSLGCGKKRAANEGIEESKRDLANFEAKLQEINDRLERFGFFSNLFKRKRDEKEKLLKARENVAKKIEELKEEIKYRYTKLAIIEEEETFYDNYQHKYLEIVKSIILPNLKEAISKDFSQEDAEVLNMLLDNYVRNAFNIDEIRKTWTIPFRSLSYILEAVREIPFDRTMSNLNNALAAIFGLSRAIVSANQLEKKDIYSVLDVIRKELCQIPTDSVHGKLENKFRDKNLDTIGNEFMEYTADNGKIDEAMEFLNGKYLSLMQEENIEEYIKKAGLLWYHFVLIHPYIDGNGRTGRYLLNLLLAERGIIIPSLFNTSVEKDNFEAKLDKCVLHTLRPSYEKLGEVFYDYIKDIAIDLTGQNRLGTPSLEPVEEIKEEEGSFNK